MREIKFRDCQRFPKYEVGSDGSVFSKDYNHTGKRMEMRQYLDQDGYPYVFFVVDGKRYKKATHRLVAEAFLPEVEGKNQVNHINGNREDNRLENLEWVTPRENVLHSYRSNGRKVSKKTIESITRLSRGVNNPKAKMTEEKVREIRRMRKVGASLKELSEAFDISTAQASAIANYKFWKHVRDNHLLEQPNAN